MCNLYANREIEKYYFVVQALKGSTASLIVEKIIS